MDDRKLIIAIDGPAGAGKSAAARLLAARLGLPYVDTGALYRAVALQALERGLNLPPTDPEGVQVLVELARTLQIRFAGPPQSPQVWLGERDVSSALRSKVITKASSLVSAIPEVRAALLGVQRALGRHGAVVEGRDIGTVVFPDAAVKFFLTARPEVRAQRRFGELKLTGLEADFAQVLEEIRQRDLRDSTRRVAPLRPAPDAIVVDTSDLTLEQVVQELLRWVGQQRAGS